MTREIIIHAGLPATNSNLIQRTLLNNKNLLAEKGYNFLHLNESGNSSGSISVNRGEILNASISEKFYNLVDSSENNCIISAEYLSFVHDEYEISRLKDFLITRFDRIVITFCLSNQAKVARFFNFQASNGLQSNQMPSSIVCGHEKNVLPELNKSLLKLLDYNSKISLWSRYFGLEAICIFNLDLFSSFRDFFKEFISKCNLPECLDLISESEPQLNKSRFLINQFFLKYKLPKPNLNASNDNYKLNNLKVNSIDYQIYEETFFESNKLLKKDFYCEIVPLPEEFITEAKDHYSSFEISEINNHLVAKLSDIADLILAQKILALSLYISSFKQDVDVSLISLFNYLLNTCDDRPEIDYLYVLTLRNVLLKEPSNFMYRYYYYWGINDSSFIKNDVPINFARDEIFLFDVTKDIKTPGSYVGDLKDILSRNSFDCSLPVAFGDKIHNTSQPFFTKARSVSTLNGILLRLNYDRHWKPHSDFFDTLNFREKLDSLVWRGASTGYDTESENPRYLFVHKYFEKYDVGFSKLVQGREWKHLLKEPLTIEEQLKYKFIAVLEGNDVATSLKWILKSNSVPFMSNPTKESWLMEGILQPYVHYVPIKADFSNLEHMVAWAIKNPELISQISENGKKFMHIFSDDKVEKSLEDALLRQFSIVKA